MGFWSTAIIAIAIILLFNLMIIVHKINPFIIPLVIFILFFSFAIKCILDSKS